MQPFFLVFLIFTLYNQLIIDGFRRFFMIYEGLPKKTPLYEEHLRIEARLVDFSGWLLPVQYSSIISEHMHTREANSIFDICHMGEIIIKGSSAATDLSRILTCNAAAMKDFTCRYGFILNENGTFIDDVILYRYSYEYFMLVVNSGRISIDYNWLTKHCSADTAVVDISDSVAKIDLQGPLSVTTAKLIFPEIDFGSLKRFTFTDFIFNGIKITVSATGYTGEDGFEFFMPSEFAADLWRIFLSVSSVMPAGLGARDSLRLEKGFSLYGHEIDDSINPVEAGLEKFIDPNRSFIGSSAFNSARLQGVSRRLVPILCEGRRTARKGFRVYAESNDIGVVTSGVFSPVLKKGIGMCLISADYSGPGNGTYL